MSHQYRDGHEHAASSGHAAPGHGAPGKRTQIDRLSAAATGDTGAVEDAAPMVWRSLDDVLKGHTRLIDDAPAKYRHALTIMFELDGFSHAGTPRTITRFDEAMKDLAPILQVAKRADDTTESDPADLRQRIAALRTDVVRAEAHGRVDHAVIGEDAHGQKKALEEADDAHPREQAEFLRGQLPKLIKTIHEMVERGATLKSLTEAKELVGEKLEGSKALARLESLGRVLALAEGWLKLTDEEFRNELGEIRGVMHGVSTYGELVKTVVEMSSATIGLSCTVGAAIAKHVGNHALAERLAEAGEKYTGILGKVASGIEIIHGASVMLDSTATREQRIDGAAEMGMGIGGLATTITAGTGVGSMVVAGPYYLAKTAAYLYREAALGFETGFLREMFSSMQDSGGSIAHAVDQLAAAELLARDEKDPERKAALTAEEERRAIFVGSVVDAFLDRAKSAGAGHGVGNEQVARLPGNYRIVAEAFAPLQGLRHARTGPAASTAAAAVLDKIAWCFNHADDIAIGSVKHMGLAQVEAAEAADAAAAEKKKRE